MSLKTTLLTILCSLMPLLASAQNLPDVKLSDARGRPVRMSSLIDGKTPVAVTFWSTTCKYCIDEIDALGEALEDYEELPLRVVCVSVDDSRSLQRAKAMAASRGWDGFTVLYDTNRQLYRALNVVNIPQLFVYDKDGRLIHSHTGYSPGDELEILKKLL